MSGYYDTAQVGTNGHVVNEHFHERPAHNERFCSFCGEHTITWCEKCGAEIRGSYEVPSVAVLGPGLETPPSFCHEGGHSYPWAGRRLQAAKDMADELDELSEEEKQKLKASLDDLIRDTPQAEVAGARFKKIMRKVGKESCTAMKELMIGIAGETAKKALFGS